MSEEIKVTAEEIKEFICEIIAEALSDTKQMKLELMRSISIDEVDGKLNCVSKIMVQHDKDFIEKAVLTKKLFNSK